MSPSVIPKIIFTFIFLHFEINVVFPGGLYYSLAELLLFERQKYINKSFTCFSAVNPLSLWN